MFKIVLILFEQLEVKANKSKYKKGMRNSPQSETGFEYRCEVYFKEIGIFKYLVTPIPENNEIIEEIKV
jgi:hypothetical protein